jgi:hypothetical protein
MRSAWVQVAVAACAVLVAGCSADDAASSTASGTLVYTERATQHIRLLDVQTGVSDLIDSGQFGSVSIAPDAAHVAYHGVDQIMKVADRAGNVTPLARGGGCWGAGTWLTSRALIYCISNHGDAGYMLLPDLDGAPPRFVGPAPAIASDGTQISYVDARGDLIVEGLDGSVRRVLVASTDPTAMYHFRNVLSYTPDDRAVLLWDYETYPAKLRVVSITDGASIDVDDVMPASSPRGPTTFYGASVFSPDGSEIVMQSRTQLVAISLLTGSKRTLAEFADRVSSGGAVFLDATHVLWVRIDDHSVGDIGKYTSSLHVAGPNVEDDRTLDAPPGENQFFSAVAISPEGFIAWPGTALMVKTDGTVLAENDFSSPAAAIAEILGVTPEGGGVIARTYDDVVRYIGADGTSRDLATVAGGAGELIGPYAAYTPAKAP